MQWCHQFRCIAVTTATIDPHVCPSSFGLHSTLLSDAASGVVEAICKVCKVGEAWGVFFLKLMRGTILVSAGQEMKKEPR